MKYNSAEREKVVKRGFKLHHESTKKRLALREKFPIEVEIKDGFYIIESKLNSNETAD